LQRTPASDDREYAIRIYQTSTEKIEDYEFIYRIAAKNSHDVWVQDDLRAIIEANKAIKSYSYMFDITKLINRYFELIIK
jgi:hypothetical protein